MLVNTRSFNNNNTMGTGSISSESHVSDVAIGRENLADSLPPHESYEGKHRWDPKAVWTPQEEAKVVWKTDLYLLLWLCVMVRFVPFHGNEYKVINIKYSFAVFSLIVATSPMRWLITCLRI